MSFWRPENLLFFLCFILPPLIRSPLVSMAQLFVFGVIAYFDTTRFGGLPLRRLFLSPNEFCPKP